MVAAPVIAAEMQGERLRIAREQAFERARAREQARAAQQGTGGTVEANKKQDGPKPIGFVTIALLITVALFLDGIQGTVGLLANLTGILMPLGIGLNFFITIFAQCLFFLWFLLLGRLMVKDMKGAVSRFAIFSTQLIVEVLPVLNAAPATTSAVVTFIIICAAEDRAQKKGGVLATAGSLLSKTPFARNVSPLARVGAQNLGRLQSGSAGVEESGGSVRERRRKGGYQPDAPTSERKGRQRASDFAGSDEEFSDNISDNEKVFFLEAVQTPRGIVATGRRIALPRKFQPSYSPHVRSWTDLKRLQETRNYTHVILPDERNPHVKEHQFLRRDQVTGASSREQEQEPVA